METSLVGRRVEKIFRLAILHRHGVGPAHLYNSVRGMVRRDADANGQVVSYVRNRQQGGHTDQHPLHIRKKPAQRSALVFTCLPECAH